MSAKLKICRIVDLETAVMLVKQGIDFLGFHIIKESDLNLLENYSEINKYLIENLNFNNSVLVTKIKSVECISNILIKSNFNYIQFHFKLEDDVYDLLRANTDFKHFISVYDPKINSDVYFNHIKKISKYIILDNIEGGLGKRIEINKNIILKNNNIFIAGGISLDNIKKINQEYSPFGFDIQSSTEKAKGVKDFEYIKKLQQQIL